MSAAGAVLLIGDGMGVHQLSLGRLVKGAPLAFDGLRHVGLQLTESADSIITDSAAAATALASGRRTRKNFVGLDSEGRPVRTVLEAARDAGKATGLITTTRLTRATPAAFVAKVSHRRQEAEVARQLIHAGVDVCYGGGASYFPLEDLRSLALKGYAIAGVPGQLPGPEQRRVFALFADSHLPFVLDGGAEISLAEMVRDALTRLETCDAGFFLAVEGGRIDHACHQHDAAAIAHEVLGFDAAVAVALDRARARGDVLVLVTGDHACGGMAISETVDVEGLCSHQASVESLLDGPTSPGLLTELVYRATGLALGGADAEEIFDFPNTYWRQAALGHWMSARRGVHFFPLRVQMRQHPGTRGHDGTMVLIYAFGPGARRFTGTLPNFRIGQGLAEALRLTLQAEKP